MMMQKKLTWIALPVVGALMAYSLWNGGTAKVEEEEDHHHHDYVQFSQDQLKAHSIDTQLAKAGNLKQVVRAPAQIIIGSDNVAHVLPKAPGIALKANKNLGQAVAANEVLATLESRDMAEAKAAYLTADRKEQLTSKTWQREKSLYEKKISAATDYNTAENDWAEASIALELARQKLHALGMNDEEIKELAHAAPNSLRLYEVHSPIAGRVISRHITLGELVNTEQEIYVIANLSKVWAEISVFAQDRPYIKEGQPVTIATADGRKTQAKVVYISPVIDQETRTSTALAEIDNASEEWLPGTFAQAELITENIPVAIIIPKEAVQNVEGANAVFVAENDGFAVRSITTGREDENHYEVLSGLEKGETYASKNTFMLKAELQKDEAEHMD